MEDPTKTGSLDLFGVKPIADAINKTTSALIDGAAAVFSRVWLPAAEELGLTFRDRVSHWRALQLASFAEKVEAKLDQQNIPPGHHAHPRLLHQVVENACWTDDKIIQDMWAGLLVSGCTEDGEDESNLLFAQLLNQMTRLQARLLKYSCQHCRKILSTTGLLGPDGMRLIRHEEMISITEECDLQRLDREIDHLREIGLLGSGAGYDLNASLLVANICPTSLALQLYVRCEGCRGTPGEFFGLKKCGEDEPVDYL